MKRFLKKAASMCLVVVMMITMMQSSLGQNLTAKAAEGAATNIRIHFYNEYNWTIPTVQYWGGDAVIAENSAEATEIAGWNGAVGYPMTAEMTKDADGNDIATNWYTLQMKGTFNGFQFLDLNAPGDGNTGGKGYDVNMAQFSGETPTDLYCMFNKSTGYECVWYTDADRTVPLTAPAEEVPTEPISVKASDLVQVEVDGTKTDMQIYLNGVFEAACDLEAGSHEAKLSMNGVETGSADQVTLEAGKKVYFRLQDGVLYDSVNKSDLIHTAAWTGNFTGLSLLSDPANAESGYAIEAWKPSDPKADLTYLGGGIYERTFYFKTLENDVTLQDAGYKISFDDDDNWSYSFGNGGDNIPLTIPAGTSELTVFVDEINKVVYDSVRTPAFEIAQNDGAVSGAAFTTSVSLIGDVRGAGDDNWNAGAKGYEFSQISDTLYRYQKTFAKGTYNYKVVFNYQNWYEKEEGNQAITVPEDNTNVVFLYDTTTGLLSDSINDTSKVAQQLGMQAAPVEAKVTDLANGATQFTMPADTGSKVTLYYALKADVEKTGAAAFTKLELAKKSTDAQTGKDVYQSENLFFGDEAVDYVYYYKVNGEDVLDSSRDSVKVGDVTYSSYQRAAFTGRTVNVPGTFPGPSWDATSNAMTYQGNGLYKYTFKDVPAANYQFKIAFAAWSENYGAGGIKDGENYNLTVTEKQDISVYYNDFSHLAVTGLDYIFADLSLTGSGIPQGTKLTDSGLTGIYSATVSMKKGTYADIKIQDLNSKKDYAFGSIELSEDKDVTFYFDPSSEIYYSDASNDPIEEEYIYYNTKATDCKSVYGAVATGEDVTFTIRTGADMETVKMVVKGVEKKNLSLKKDGEAVDGIQKWSVTTNFNTIGEVQYYFVLSNGSSVKIYADDDGFYGEGKVTDLTSITPYDLVIYENGFETPDWMKNAVVYQIFPERFMNGDVSNDFAQTSARGETDYEYITDWDTLPENPEQEAKVDQDTYEATGAYFGDGNWSNEIYGGDLEGITERVDYLKALGVNVIYLNPVFASISSHRYDTSDYEMIDPILGDMGDFKELVKVAEENDMHIVLDGVFNHVSDDSKYFDRYYKYLEAGTDTIGAYPYWAYVYDYMSENSVDQAAAETAAKDYFGKNYGITDYSYTGWFDISKDSYVTDENKNAVTDGIGLRAGKPVYSYEGWWGYDSMPVIMSTNGSEYQTGDWGEEIIGNADETSVTQYWLSEGSNGWRLDVANEVSDETWQKFRESVKELDSDAVIIGEIWDDATEYLLGDMYDSVMNYVFRGAVISYAKGGSATDMVNTLEKIRERYPKEAFYAMMNLVGSHDTSRVLSYLDGIDDDRKDTSLEAAFPTYESTSDAAKARQYLVAFLQFTYAGAPTIYYGDEIGMVGADDPDDRRAFAWGEGNKELVTWYATLANIRANYAALRTGEVEVFDAKNTEGQKADSVVSYVRRDDTDAMIVLANNATSDTTIVVDLDELDMTETTLTDLISGSEITVTDGKATITIPALSGAILTADAKAISVDQNALAPAYDASYAVADRVVATGIALSENSAELKTDETVTLSTTVTPADATNGGAVVWSSSDKKVATVSKDGVVTAVGAGKAVITATAMYSKDHVDAICNVTVTAKASDEQKPGGGGSDDGSDDDGSAGSDQGDNTGSGDGSNVPTGGSGSNSTTTAVAGVVIISDAAGWAEVSGKIDSATEGTEITVEISKDADTITSGVLSKLARTKATLKVKLENGITWKIDGSKLKAGASYGDIDLGVAMNTSNIPAKLVEAVPDAKQTVQLSLDFSGEFGYEMTMNVPLGTENKGMFANLYYYNPVTGKLEFMSAAKIAEDGSADLGFTHASDYVVVISEKNLEHTNVTPAVETGDQAPLAMIFVVLLGMACVGAGVYRGSRKRRV